MPPRFAYACFAFDFKERRFSNRRLKRTAVSNRPSLMRNDLQRFFTNRPRFSERRFAGTNSPSFRISFPSK